MAHRAEFGYPECGAGGGAPESASPRHPCLGATRPMTRLILLALLGVLVLPAAALAAPAKISPRTASVSAAGVATVEVADPNRYALRGTAKVTVRGRTMAKRTVRLPKRSVTGVKLRFKPQAVAALRDAAGRATAKLSLRRPGGRRSSARRTLTLRVPTARRPRSGPRGGQPAPAAATRWAGRMGTEGAYDDFEFTVSNGQMQITKPALRPGLLLRERRLLPQRPLLRALRRARPLDHRDRRPRRQAGHLREPAGLPRHAHDQLQGDRHHAAARQVSGTLGMSFSTPTTTSSRPPSRSSTAPARSPSRRCRPARPSAPVRSGGRASR